MNPTKIAFEFDLFLSENGVHLECILVGGAALGLQKIIHRETKDWDVLVPELDEVMKRTARQFARSLQSENLMLEDKWLNNGPANLIPLLPDGWKDRILEVFRGKSLTVSVLGRGDLLKTKLFAWCDRDLDRADCVAMNPSRKELGQALSWVEYQDANPLWPEHVRDYFQKLARELGYEL